MENQWELSRRDFLKSSASVAGSFIVAFHLPIGSGGGRRAEAAESPGAEYPPNAFIRIAPDDSITIVINKLEMGQGVNTSLAQLIAEELECDWSRISSVSAPVAPVYNHTARPSQMAGGSSSVRTSYDQHRRIGAAMRQMLIAAASGRWSVPATECRAENGAVVHPRKGRLTYGQLAADAEKQPYPAEVKLKDPKDFKIIGRSVRRVDAAEKSTGKAVFGIDVKIPGMFYAMVARPPVLGAKLTAVDDSAARHVAGVKDVVRFGDSVAVLASGTWAAKQGRDALKLKWDFGGKDGFTHESLMAMFKKELSLPGTPVERRGDAATAIRKAAHRLVAEYEFPYLAHACLEPMNCTITFDGKRAEIWAGHQMPTADRDTAAEILGLEPQAVEVHTVYAGGSFGRRGNKDSDYVREAALLVKKVRKPLKIVWTREDDMKGGYFRPMNYHRVEVGLDARYRLVGWSHRIIGQSVSAPTASPSRMSGKVDKSVVEGVAGTAYDLPAFHVDLRMPTPNVSVQWWRSVGHTHTAYVMETIIDELAHQAKQDPLAFRRQLLHRSPRHLAVLDLLASKSGWGRKPPKGRALGLAIHESFQSVVGEVAEVSLQGTEVRVHRVVTAVHCGLAVNPEGARSQVEGGIIYGLTAALYGEMQFRNGEIVTQNFDQYRLLRHHEAPEIEVHFVESHEPPTGLGEPGVPPIAPAVANAVFQLTGKRVRQLPFSKGLRLG